MGTAPPLWPREYGAYAELVFPLLTAFLAGGPSGAGTAFTVAVVCWFLLYGPLAVLRGARGRRLQNEQGEPARRVVWGLALVGGVAAATGLALAPAGARLAVLPPGATAVLVLPAVVRGRPKTLGTELAVATALCAMLPVVGLAGGMALRPALDATVVWLLTYWAATLTVHAVKARAKPGLGTRWAIWGAPLLAAAAAGIGIGAGPLGLAPAATALALLPGALLLLAVAALRVHPRRLTRVGWSLTACNLVTLGLLLLA